MSIDSLQLTFYFRLIMSNYIEYKGSRFRIQSSGRYYQDNNKSAKERLLHRRIWADNYGDIPYGYVIHHKDHNWKNNDISNLELIEIGKHLSDHAKKLHKEPEYIKKNKESLNKAQKKAKEWHSSKEGLNWHSKHGKDTWIDRKKDKIICILCGKESQKHFVGRKDVRFCSSSCQDKEYYKKI
jgi:hypothetical protein